MGDEKKGLLEVTARALMSFYHEAKTKVRVRSELSEEFLVQVGIHQGSMASSPLFAIAVDIISEKARERLMNEILYAVDLVLINKSIENLQEKFFKWKKPFESKRLKINLKKTTVMVSSLKGEILKSKAHLCAKCGKREIANSVMCTECGIRVA